jgi:hypothetical protein
MVITGADALFTGAAADYGLTVTYSDGLARTVIASWTSSNAAVASVDASGRLAGLTHGSSTLTADYFGSRASRTVQVINDYGGTWEGKYAITACTVTGDLATSYGGWCLAGPGRVGTVYSVRMTLVQNDQNPTEVTRTFNRSRDSLKGTVRADGRLSLEGTLPERDYYEDNIIGKVEFGQWLTSLTAGDRMEGGWSEHYTSFAGRGGTAHTVNELLTMTRVSTDVQTAGARR